MEKNRRILVIDDNLTIHEDFRKILCQHDSRCASLSESERLLFGRSATTEVATTFEIDSALQGEEGLEMVRQARQEGRPYTIAFVDVRMPPGWSGVETIEHIWVEDPEIQFVIVTAYMDYSPDQILDRFGVSDRLLIIKKPCERAEILLLATALNKKWNLARRGPLSEDSTSDNPVAVVN
jgi:CheY-like chemotaxis protein